MKKDIPFLNVLRGIAAFIVLTSHCMIWTNWYGLPLPSAKLAVDLFMILSGYLMTYHAMLRADKEPLQKPRSWIKFYIRRYFRLAPAYYVALLLAAVIIPVPFIHGYQTLSDIIPGLNASIYNPGYTHYTFVNLVAHVTFIFGLLPQYTLSTLLPDWSLSLEIQFYLLFPFIYLLFRRFGYIKITFIITVLCAVITEWFSGLNGIHGSAGLFPEPSFILMKLYVFLIGILLCEATTRKELLQKQRFYICSVALLLTIVDAMLYPYFWVCYEIGWLILASLLIFWLASDYSFCEQAKNAINKASENRFWRFMSEASYSVYLFHGFFISLLGGAFFKNIWFLQLPGCYRTLILWIFVLTGSYMTAFIMCKYIEKPGIRLGKYIIAKIR